MKQRVFADGAAHILALRPNPFTNSIGQVFPSPLRSVFTCVLVLVFSKLGCVLGKLQGCLHLFIHSLHNRLCVDVLFVFQGHKEEGSSQVSAAAAYCTGFMVHPSYEAQLFCGLNTELGQGIRAGPDLLVFPVSFFVAVARWFTGLCTCRAENTIWNLLKPALLLKGGTVGTTAHLLGWAISPCQSEPVVLRVVFWAVKLPVPSALNRRSVGSCAGFAKLSDPVWVKILFIKGLLGFGERGVGCGVGWEVYLLFLTQCAGQQLSSGNSCEWSLKHSWKRSEMKWNFVHVWFNKRRSETDLFFAVLLKISAKEVIEKEDQEERSLQELTAGKGFIAFVAQEYMK